MDLGLVVVFQVALGSVLVTGEGLLLNTRPAEVIRDYNLYNVFESPALNGNKLINLPAATGTAR